MRLNGCPCGFYGDSVKQCTCAPSQVARYQQRISGPLLDRIDIFIEVPRVDYEKLTDDRLGEPSASARGRVETARAVQSARFNGTHLLTNADMGPVEVREHCAVGPDAQQLLRMAMEQFHAWGATAAEALENLQSVATAFMESYRARGDILPTEIEALASEAGPHIEGEVGIAA